MKRILYILSFIFFLLFGVVNDGWSIDAPKYSVTASSGCLFCCSFYSNILKKT